MPVCSAALISISGISIQIYSIPRVHRAPVERPAPVAFSAAAPRGCCVRARAGSVSVPREVAGTAGDPGRMGSRHVL